MKDKEIVLVTGGGRGIGRALVNALASPDRLVYIHYSSSGQAAGDLADQMEKEGKAARTIQADLADPVACKALVAEIIDESGRLDILVNNAGMTRDRLAVRMSDDDYDQVIAVNQRAPFILMREAAKSMMRSRRGRIINISSVVGLTGNAGQINYAASKAALIAMTKSLAQELGSRQVTVNAVAPGFIETDMTAGLSEEIQKAYREAIPLGRFGQAEEVAALVAFLASREAAYITGQTICVDGGINR
jgi:3-oxoacyl-[acyl-carrier protein] reductase